MTGGGENDILQGGDGNDSLNGEQGVDRLTGGAGNDLFTTNSGHSGTTAGALDQILDWQATDSLHFNGGAAGVEGSSYIEQSAASYDAALTLANGQIAGGVVNYVVVQVGNDVVVFADTGNNNGTAEDAVVLVGRTLADISAANVV
jgi:Ca2+-binding RTX toxin-like protein